MRKLSHPMERRSGRLVGVGRRFRGAKGVKVEITPTFGRGPCADSGSQSPRDCTCTMKSGSNHQDDDRSSHLAAHRRACQHLATAEDRLDLRRILADLHRYHRLQDQCRRHVPTQRRLIQPLAPAEVRRRAACCLRTYRCLRARSLLSEDRRRPSDREIGRAHV